MFHIVVVVPMASCTRDCMLIDMLQLLFHNPEILSTRAAMSNNRCQYGRIIVEEFFSFGAYHIMMFVVWAKYQKTRGFLSLVYRTGKEMRTVGHQKTRVFSLGAPVGRYGYASYVATYICKPMYIPRSTVVYMGVRQDSPFQDGSCFRYLFYYTLASSSSGEKAKETVCLNHSFPTADDNLPKPLHHESTLELVFVLRDSIVASRLSGISPARIPCASTSAVRGFRPRGNDDTRRIGTVTKGQTLTGTIHGRK